MVTDIRTDGHTDGRTDKPFYRDARTHLKRPDMTGTIQSSTIKDLLIPFVFDGMVSIKTLPISCFSTLLQMNVYDAISGKSLFPVTS